MKAFARTPELDEFVDAYTASLRSTGLSGHFPADSVARSFFVKVGIERWECLSLAEQLELPAKFRRVVSWLLASQRMKSSVAYMAVGRPWVGKIGRYVHTEFYARFTAVAAEVGFDERSGQLQWAALMKVAALHQVKPEEVTAALLQAVRLGPCPQPISNSE
jgi:hypothetical protein